MQSQLPCLEPQRLNAQLVGRENLVEAWREATRSAILCEPLTPERFDASISAYNLDGLVFSRSNFGPARGALLAGALRGIWGDLCAGRVYEPTIVAEAFLGLINGLVDHSLAPVSAGDPLVCMEAFLREHLADPTLGPEHLQHAFHYSRSSIYRLFEHHGGVAVFIRSERLRRCHAEIIRSNTTRRPISTIAARHGFYDHSHFSRVFRHAYGIAPSQLAEIVANRGVDGIEPTIDDTVGAHTIRSWLQAV